MGGDDGGEGGDDGDCNAAVAGEGGRGSNGEKPSRASCVCRIWGQCTVLYCSIIVECDASNVFTAL